MDENGHGGPDVARRQAYHVPIYEVADHLDLNVYHASRHDTHPCTLDHLMTKDYAIRLGRAKVPPDAYHRSGVADLRLGRADIGLFHPHTADHRNLEGNIDD